MKLTIFTIAAALASATLAGSQASAADEQTLFNCFNKVQLTDGALVSIVRQAAGGAPALKLEWRGSKKYVALTPSTDRMIIDGSVYEGDGVEVTIHNGVEVPPARAAVVFRSTGSIYNCGPAQP